MSNATYMGTRVPRDIRRKAYLQWWRLALLRLFPIILGMTLGWLVVLIFGRTQTENAFGHGHMNYNTTRYPKASPKGWEFVSVPKEWKDDGLLKRSLWGIGNDEDGFIGDQRGEWSDRCKGNERSKLNQIIWSCFRNPCNNLSRFSRTFSCRIDSCNVEYWGDYDTPDNHPVYEGRHFVRATDRDTGKVYYGYREVKASGLLPRILRRAVNKSYGFKLKPSHADSTQRPEKAYKGFTWRL